MSKNVSKMLIFISGFWHLFCHNNTKYRSSYKIKDFFDIYTKWTIEKCPTVPSKTSWVLRNYRSKSVNSFAGHPVYYIKKKYNKLELSWFKLSRSWGFLLELVEIRWRHFNLKSKYIFRYLHMNISHHVFDMRAVLWLKLLFWCVRWVGGWLD